VPPAPAPPPRSARGYASLASLPGELTLNDTIFTRDGAHWLPTEHAFGPWGETLHGGAPSALLAHVLETLMPEGMTPARCTFDLFRPVPRQPLTVEHRVLRAGRRIHVLELTVRAGGEACVHAVMSCNAHTPLGALANPAPCPLPAPDALPEFALAERLGARTPVSAAPMHGLHTRLRVRVVDGVVGEGAGRGWLHLPLDLAPGVPLSPFAHLAALADFSNGIAQRRLQVAGGTVGFINADISLHVLRMPAPGSIGIVAQSNVDSAGRALVQAAFHDRSGLVAHVLQTSLASPSPMLATQQPTTQPTTQPANGDSR
jgi:acyl-coenzyme A thioesterase PaaI-like protein